MELRVIAPEDYDTALAGTELESVLEHLKPSRAMVFGVFDGETLLGCWSLLPVMHAEGLWVHPEHRGRAGVQRSLVEGLVTLARHHGSAVVMTSAVNERVESLIRHAGGTKLPGSHWALPIAALEGA